MSDLIKQTMGAGEVIRWRRAAGLLLVNEASAPINIQLMRNGSEIFAANEVGRGIKVRPAEGFDETVLHNATAGAVDIEVFMTGADVDVQIATGITVTVDNSPANPVPVDVQGAVLSVSDVEINNTALNPVPVDVLTVPAVDVASLPDVVMAGAMLRGAFTNLQKTVTTADAQLLAANAARRYLLIQNKDSYASIWVSFGGVAATTANGVLIAPGGALELSGYVPSGEIRAIGDSASNANITTLEG